MNARDIGLAADAGAHWEHGDWNLASSVHFSEEDLQTFADLIREDATEQANARAKTSWTLMCKKMVAAEREACAKVCDEYDVADDVNSCDTAEGIAIAIRARGNT